MEAVLDRPFQYRSNSASNTSATGCSSSSSNPSTTSELFICFTSRPSSSMKLFSKSIISPARARSGEPSSQISLSTSLSRRLRSNGSIRGGGQASPMFPRMNGGKKRGCAFENPEPSSPKVTCIGQVRVKTKKKGKKMRPTHSKRGGGEVSYGRVEKISNDNSSNTTSTLEASSSSSNNNNEEECNLAQRNQRWVHFPSTICEALRAFGAEFNCFLPCRSSCLASEKAKGEKAKGSSNGRSCVAVFTRWLLAVQEGDGKGREIELVVGEEEEEDEERVERRRRSYRRHVFEELEFKDEDVFRGNGNLDGGGEEKEEGRVSICIPPKNALLLMRCRSNPVKMAALANKLWEAPVLRRQEDEEEDTDVCKKWVCCEGIEEHESQESNEPSRLQFKEEGKEEEGAENGDGQKESREEEPILTQEAPLCESSHEKIGDPDVQESVLLQETAEEEEGSSVVSENLGQEFKEAVQISEDQDEPEPPDSKEKVTHQRPGSDEDQEGQMACFKSKERGSEQAPLPDCLLLMMCEPMLSMEVSKETWVCSTHFIRSLPALSRPLENKTNAQDKPQKRISIDNNAASVRNSNAQNTILQQQQPPRSSCSYPAKPPSRVPGTESMATVIEQKLVGGQAYEPFVLTRCKSEPMRTAAKLASEACFWKNRKLEPHRAAAAGVRAAAVGF